jgi:hypothetical protein
MVLHRTGPGVQDGKASEASAQIAGIARELLQGGGCRAHEQAVDLFLVCQRKWAQLLWQRKGKQIVPTWQQTGTLLIDPALGLLAVTLGTAAITTGVIDVDLAPAVITQIDMASEVRRPARLDVIHRSRLTGKQAIPDACTVRRTVETENIRHQIGRAHV